MTVKVKFSNEFKDKQKRIENLPVFMRDFVLATLKQDAQKLIKIFHDGIKKDEFGLDILAAATVSAKKKKGFKKPETPLYGKGDDEEKKSYVNLLRIKKLPDGWKVYPSWAKHWDVDVRLDTLFHIHEFGATLQRKDGTLIRIPARPAFLMAYKKMLTQKGSDDRETSRIVKKAIKAYINNAQKIDEVLKKEKIRKNKKHEE